LTYLISPQKDNLIVGTANPLLVNGFLHVFATDAKDRAVYLVRWRKSSVSIGTLTSPQWWTGERAGWVGPRGAAKPASIMAQGQMEFSVEYAPRLKGYVQIQTLSIVNPCVALSFAESLTGPWSEQECFFTPPEQGLPGFLIYAAKSHPMLKGADMVFTYVVNTTREDRLLQDMSIYFPIMLKGQIKGDGVR